VRRLFAAALWRVGNIGTGTFGWLNIVPTLQALTA